MGIAYINFFCHCKKKSPNASYKKPSHKTSNAFSQ